MLNDLKPLLLPGALAAAGVTASRMAGKSGLLGGVLAVAGAIGGLFLAKKFGAKAS